MIVLEQAEQAGAKKNVAQKELSAIQKKITERLVGGVPDKKARTAVSNGVGMYARGVAAELPPEVLEEEKADIEKLKPALLAHASLREDEEKAKTVLQYVTLMKIRNLEGGIEALERWHISPSLLTTYLWGGEEAVHALLTNNDKAEALVEVPEVDTGTVASYQSNGKTILVYEDRAGRFTDPLDEDFHARLLKKIEGTNYSLVVLTPPEGTDADCSLLVFSGAEERDATTDELEVVAGHYARKYSNNSLSVEINGVEQNVIVGQANFVNEEQA